MLWSKAIGAGGAGGVVEGWNVSTAVFNQSFLLGSGLSEPRALFFRPDGTKMYIYDGSGRDVNEYDLTTAWDVASAVFTQNKNPGSLLSYGLFFKPDGTKMYIYSDSYVHIKEYDLGAPWDVVSAVVSSKVSPDYFSLRGIFFRSDGEKMYAASGRNDRVYEYALSTAWDISSLVLTQSLFIVDSVEGFITDVFFKHDGAKMYVVGSIDDSVSEYDLSTSWDISTAVFLRSFPISGQEGQAQGLFFKPDGTKMYVVGTTSNAVHEYDLTA